MSAKTIIESDDYYEDYGDYEVSSLRDLKSHVMYTSISLNNLRLMVNGDRLNGPEAETFKKKVLAFKKYLDSVDLKKVATPAAGSQPPNVLEPSVVDVIANDDSWTEIAVRSDHTEGLAEVIGIDRKSEPYWARRFVYNRDLAATVAYYGGNKVVVDCDGIHIVPPRDAHSILDNAADQYERMSF